MKFIFLSPTTRLDWHVDKGTKSAVIWKMSGDDPIEFREKCYKYEMAIVDTSKEHRVAPLANERVLFKLSSLITVPQFIVVHQLSIKVLLLFLVNVTFQLYSLVTKIVKTSSSTTAWTY